MCRSKRDLQNIQSYGEVLFGIHPVLLALQASKRKRFFSLFIHSKQKSKMTKSILQIQTLAKTQGVPVSYVSKSTLTHLSCNRPHQVRFSAVCCTVNLRANAVLKIFIFTFSALLHPFFFQGYCSDVRREDVHITWYSFQSSNI